MFKKAFLSLSLLIFGFSAMPAQAGQGVLTPVGPGKGTLGTVVVSPSSPGQVWLGIPAEGIGRSDDRGSSWQWAGRALAGWPIEAMTADPSKPGALWAANYNGVYRTEDGGAHWRRITDSAFTAALAETAPRDLAVVGETLYIQTYRRLLASRNGGQTWEVSFEATDGDALIVFGAGAPGLFLTTGGASGTQFLKSQDGGLTWSPVPGDWQNSAGIAQIEVTPTGVYAVPIYFNATVQLQEGRLLRSQDGGATWQRVLGSSGEYFSAGPLAVDARNPRTLWVFAQTWAPGPQGHPEAGLWLSRDGGTTWRRRGTATPGTRLTVEPGTPILYASSFEALWRTLDGGRTWQTLLRKADGESPPSQVIFQPGNPARMALLVVDRLAWTQDGGLSWSMPSPEMQLHDMDIDPNNPNRWLALKGGPRLDVSLDAGRNWSRSISLPSSYADQLIRIDRKTIFAGGCGLSRSVDNGQTWTTSLACSTRYAPDTGRFLRKLVADPADPAKLYALTAQIKDFYPNYDTLHDWPSILWQSGDGGRTWRKIANNLKAIAVSPNGGRIYAISGLNLLVSDDGGKTLSIQAHLPKEAYDLTVRKDDPDALFALFSAGVLYSANGGGTWTQFQTGLDPRYYEVGWLSALVPHPKDPRTVFVTSHGVVLHLRVP